MENKTYNKKETAELGKERLKKSMVWKDGEKKTYFLEQLYDNFALFRSEFGFKRCFTYREVLNNLY